MSLWNDSVNNFAALWLETLIRACWQGGVALALVWAVCRLLPRLPAWGRCWLWRLACLKLLAALLWLPTLDLRLLPPEPSAASSALTDGAAATATPESMSADSLPVVGLSAVAAPAAVPTVAGWLLLFWIGSLLWQGGQAIRQGLAVRRLHLTGKPLDGGLIDGWNVALCCDLGLGCVPRLLASTATTTPLLIGMLRPCIVLPETLLTTCTPDELRLILAHELAHVRRRDLLWGWLPLLTRLVCGFHPLVRLAEREIAMAQEVACDEIALRLTAAAPATYGSLLVRVAARLDPCSARGFGMIGMTESYHTLKRRLSAMKSFPSAPRPYRTAVRFGLLTLGLAALMPWHVAAQSTPPTALEAPMVPPLPTVPVAPTTPALPSRAENAPKAPTASRPGGVASVRTRSARTVTRSAVSVSKNSPIVTVFAQAAAPSAVTISRSSSRRAATVRSQDASRAFSVTFTRDAPATSAVVITRTASQDSATEGYPMAAPGMISPARPATEASAPSVTVAPRSIRTRGRASRATATTPALTESVLTLPREGAAPEAAADPFVQADPTRATPSPFRSRASRRDRRRSGDPTAAPPASGAVPADPFARTRSTTPEDPTVVPARPIGIPADPAQSPGSAPSVLPVAPVATPPVNLPAPPASKVRGVRSEVPLLSHLPYIGRLFRSIGPVLPPVRRGVPVLEAIPLIGRLFQTAPPVAPLPDLPVSNP